MSYKQAIFFTLLITSQEGDRLDRNTLNEERAKSGTSAERVKYARTIKASFRMTCIEST
jgi:hypothetical protein